MSEPVGESEPSTSSRWMSRTFHALLVIALLVAVGFRIYSYFATSETELASQPPVIPHQDFAQLRTTAYAAYAEEDWAAAAEVFGVIVENNPKDLRARIGLADSLHKTGRHDLALNEFLWVCQFDGGVKRWALCRIAGIYAIKGDKRLALDYLNESVAEGYRLRSQDSIVDDPDFESLRDDAEFQRLAELLKRVAQRNVYRRFDFLIGNWTLTGRNDQRIGTWVVRRDGHALHGQCVNESASFTMTFFAYYDPFIEQWKQIWLDEQGQVIELQGVPVEPDSLVLHGHQMSDGGKKAMARAVYREGEGGIVSVEIATSNDDGLTWQSLLKSTLLPTRRPPEQNDTSVEPTAEK